ncbi:MAG: hypothetical protein ACSHYA_17465 [Opitutaceae bacterium]
MCALKKDEDQDPSIYGMLLYGFMSAVLGAFLGFFYLASFSATAIKSSSELVEFKETRKDRLPRPGDVYYLKGATQTDGIWAGKRQAFLDGRSGTIDITDSELNVWLASKFQPAAAPKGHSAPKVMIIPGVPNVHFAKEALYLSLPTDFVFYGSKFSKTVFLTGEFSKGSDSVEFSMSSLHIDNANVPLTDVLGMQIVNTLMQAYAGSPEFAAMRDAWAAIDSVGQADGILRLVIR